ncbi:MAG: zincin-like metallopeptidase domain-containing protein [Raineya sp.]|jgi:antirestriction protein ArdC|nr:zincin-like metallopeptidase domain-containing protein [Raineya sp.]
MKSSNERLDVYQIITEKIIQALEKGIVPWKQPFKSISTGLLPHNFVTGKRYRGVNLILLGSLNYPIPAFFTFQQINELGGKVKKGEKGTPVIYWNTTEKENEKGETEKKSFLKYYTVFNIGQTEGIEIPTKYTNLIQWSESERLIQKNENCERIIEEYPNKPIISIEEGNKAAYYPKLDKIVMPTMAQFFSDDEYYATLFHELIHSTGHEKRLSRPSLTEMAKFGDEKYSKEELVAEIGATFLCAEAGIESTFGNSTAYIQGWINRLKDDKKLIISASRQAQEAVEYIFNKKDIQIQEIENNNKEAA